MTITLSHLLRKIEHMDITQITDHANTERTVTWVHIVETQEASAFLEGGEIAFITGIGLTHGITLLELVQFVHERGASGVIFNTGPFLESVSQDVIDFGNENDFPLFVVPWKIHLAEIMRIFCSEITKSDRANSETAAAFKNAIFFPKQEEFYVVPLSQHGFYPDWSYTVCVLRVQNENGDVIEPRLESIAIHIENHLRHQNYDKFAVFHYEKQILLVFCNQTAETLHEMLALIKETLQIYLSASEHFLLGAGKITQTIRCIYKSFRQAVAITKLQQKGQIDKQLCTYSDMGIYKILMAVDDQEVIDEYYQSTLKPLIEYDEKHDAGLLPVLRCYLMNDGSVQATANELFLHRNTINYRLNKISELLDVNLSSLNVRLQLMLGFLLQDMR